MNILLLLVLVGLNGPVVVVDDLTADKGHYATVEACQADMAKQRESVLAQLAGKPAVLADMICFDTALMPQPPATPE
jgi:hypothetical protein